MIECYYRWCEHHSLDEPFCRNDRCTATKEEFIQFVELRLAEEKKWEREKW